MTLDAADGHDISMPQTEPFYNRK